MAWEFSLLVVANVTAASDELIDCLRDRADKGTCRFTLVMPASGAEARTRLDTALERMRDAGLENVEGQGGRSRSGRGGDGHLGSDEVRRDHRLHAADRARRGGSASTFRTGSRSSPRCRSRTSSHSRRARRCRPARRRSGLRAWAGAHRARRDDHEALALRYCSWSCSSCSSYSWWWPGSRTSTAWLHWMMSWSPPFSTSANAWTKAGFSIVKSADSGSSFV